MTGQEGASGAGEVLFLGLGAVIWMYLLYQVVQLICVFFCIHLKLFLKWLFPLGHYLIIAQYLSISWNMSELFYLVLCTLLSFVESKRHPLDSTSLPYCSINEGI